MGRINTPPVGLQSLLGNTNFGDNPSDLSEVVAPTLEFFAFMAQQKVHFERNAGSLAGQGFATQIVIPDGEIWALLGVNGFVNFNAAGDEIQYQINIRDAPNIPVVDPQHVLAHTPVVTATNALEPLQLVYEPNHLWWLQPGTRLQLNVNEATSGVAVSYTLRAMYYKLTA